MGLHKIIIFDFCHKQCLLLESFFLKQFFTGKLFLFHFHFKRRALQTLVRMGEGKRKRHRKFVCLFVCFYTISMEITDLTDEDLVEPSLAVAEHDTPLEDSSFAVE